MFSGRNFLFAVVFSPCVLFSVTVRKIPFVWPPADPPFDLYTFVHGRRRGKGWWVVQPLLLHAAGMRPPPFILPKHWAAWVEKYRSAIEEGRRVRLVHCQRSPYVFDEDSDDILRSRPESSWKLLRWVENCASAIQMEVATPPFPKPAETSADMKRRRTALRLPYV